MVSPPALLANAINPLLTVCLATTPFFSPRIPAGPFWLRAAVGIGIAVALAEGGKHWQVWPGRPTFPSGHETFALAASTFLISRDRRWAYATLPLVLALAWALVAAHFHQPLDVAGAWLVGPPVALLTHHVLRPHTPSP